jgi:signal transduction histidine kinase
MRDKETIEQRAREKSEELIKTQLELAQAKRLSDIGFLAATVAHELRNPLAAITMAAANIKRKAPIADLGNNLNTIANKIAESNQIINNLLFYSKLRPPKLERIKLSTLLEECIENIEKQNQNELKIKVQTASIQDMLINADLLQLKEVFLNLLNNAVDAVDEKSGKIELWAETTPAEIHVYVKDNGTGITTEDLERIFDPFFTTKAKGTGLGLTICNQIIKLHDGHITIESKVQYGTTLLISLPRQVELGQ